VLGVGEQQRRLDLECDLGGILAGVDRALSLRVPDRGLEPVQPVAQEADEPVADGAGLHVDLGQDRGEETAAGEGVGLEIGQVTVHEQAQPLHAAAGRRRWLDDAGEKDRAGGLDGRELEFLLGAEVREQAALAHPHRVGEPRDRQAADALDRGQAGGRIEDRAPALLPVAAAGPGAPLGRFPGIHACILARPVVLYQR
jgi:hypothetical protein